MVPAGYMAKRVVERPHWLPAERVSQHLFCQRVRLRELHGVEPSFGTNVSVPEAKVIEGYDVVTFSARTSPECSPLSCNSLVPEVETNSRCLLQFEQARKLLESGTFNNSEPGPYRIFAVYSVAWPRNGS